MDYIYALRDPRVTPVQWRYVGKTNHPYDRLMTHLSPSSLKHKSRVSSWLKSLKRDSVKPVMKILQRIFEGYSETWEEAERKWIMIFREMGYDLTNGTDGGGRKYSIPAVVASNKRRKGEKRPPPSEEWRRKQRESHLGQEVSPETVAKIVAKTRGRVVKAGTRKAIGDALRGVPKSPQHRASMSQVRLGKSCSRRTPEHYSSSHRRNIGVAVSRAAMKKTPEERSEHTRRAWVTRRVKQAAKVTEVE